MAKRIQRKKTLAAALRVAFLISCLLAGSAARGGEFAVFYALDADWKAIERDAGKKARSVPVGDRKIRILRDGAHTIRGVKMGSGATETAVSAQALLAKWPSDLAISIGPAGALANTEEVAIGRWLRLSEVAAHQVGSLREEGFAFNKKKGLWMLGTLDAERFPLTKELAALGEAKLASGEVFVASETGRADIRAATGAALVDMNALGLMSAIRSHGVPSLHLRIVSDRADGEASATFRKFAASYDGAGGSMILRFLRALPPDPEDPASYPELRALLGEDGSNDPDDAEDKKLDP